MNKSKLVLSVIGTAIVAWLTSFVNSFVSVQCTDVAMMTVRDPMGPIWLYKQMAGFCRFGNGLVILVGVILIGMIWYFGYKQSIQNLLKENS